MDNKGLNTVQYQYPQAYTVPVKDGKQSAVNVYINTPQPCSACPYPYYYPYYYPYPYYIPQYQPAQQQHTQPVASQDLKQDKKPAKPKKPITPLTPELLNQLQADLTQGDKLSRGHAVARVINLLNEDRKDREKDQRIIGLLNTASHPNQPKSVREAANAAATSMKYSIPGQKLNVVSEN